MTYKPFEVFLDLTSGKAVDRRRMFLGVAVTVYGSSHDFAKTALAWNKLHPNQQFSVIKIVPKGIEK